MPVILRSFPRDEKEWRDDLDHWKHEFPRIFLRGIIRAQRIIKLRRAYVEARRESATSSRDSKATEQEVKTITNIALDQNTLMRVAEKAKTIAKQLDEQAASDRGSWDKEQTESSQTFKHVSDQIWDLEKYYKHGADRLGRRLDADGRPLSSQGVPLGRNGIPLNEVELDNRKIERHATCERCPEALPTGRPLQIPQMSRQPDAEKYYELIRECYVDGMMDGEALEARYGGEGDGQSLKDEFFEIR